MSNRSHHSMLSLLLDLLFANRCVLCSRLGPSCCNECWSGLLIEARPVQRIGTDGKKLEGTALCDFDAKVSTLIHAYKDQGRTSLVAQFASAMVSAVLEIGKRASAPADFYLVAVPSRMSSTQNRGFSPAELIATSICRRLEPKCRLGKNFVWFSLESADQASLGQNARKENLRGTMTAGTRVLKKRVILIDDIVTTGSSLLETARALEAAGAEVLGFVTFSETILRNIGKTLTKGLKKV